MDLFLINENFERFGLIDNYETMIWTERYCGYGDFEIFTIVNDEIMNDILHDCYVGQKDSNSVMIIEHIEIHSDSEEGGHITVSGRSLESILCRRIIWEPTILQGNLQEEIQKLLNNSIINPSISERKIDNFIFEINSDPAITELEIAAQFYGENLYDVIFAVCESYGIGFKLILTEDGEFVFKLYSGADRSYGQQINPYVIFSPKFENLINSNYIDSRKMLKTVTLVVGEGERYDRESIVVEIESGGGSGLSRREMFTDAGHISSTVDEQTLTNTEYAAQLAQKGFEDLAENTLIKSFEGGVEATQLFVYGSDFFLGDIIQITNEYGVESRARVTEIVRSQSVSGTAIFPTFSTVT